MNRTPYYLDVLLKIFEFRRAKNPRYSLRAYSKYLGMDASAMSRVLRSKQPLTARNCEEILRKLKLGAVHQRLFVRSVMIQRLEIEFDQLIKSTRASSNGGLGLLGLPELASLVVEKEYDLEMGLKIDSDALWGMSAQVGEFLETMRAYEEVDGKLATHRLSLRFSSY